MSNGKNIEIRFQTAGAPQAAAEIKNVAAATQEAATSAAALNTADASGAMDAEVFKEQTKVIDEMTRSFEDLVEAEREIAGAGDTLGDISQSMEDVADSAPEAADALGDVSEKLSRIDRAQTAQIVGILANQLAAAGMKFRELSTDVAEFDGELAASMNTAGETMESVGSWATTVAAGFAAGGPWGAVIATTVKGLGSVTEAWIDMKKAQASVASADQEFADQQKFFAEQNALLRAQEDKQFIAEGYKREADELARQVANLERINSLRGELQSIENQRAKQNIQLTRQEGGDVALAEAQAIATALRSGLDSITSELTEGQARVQQAQLRASQAQEEYQRAVDEKADWPERQELAQALDDARSEVQEAATVFQDTATRSAAARQAFLESVEIDLRDKETQYAGQTTREAEAAFDGVYQALKEAVSTAPQAAIAAIQVEAGAITTLATEKAAEVQQGLATERDGTLQAIQQLTPSPKDTAALTAALQAFSAAQTGNTETLISILQEGLAVAQAQTVHIQNHQTQLRDLQSQIQTLSTR